LNFLKMDFLFDQFFADDLPSDFIEELNTTAGQSIRLKSKQAFFTLLYKSTGSQGAPALS